MENTINRAYSVDLVFFDILVNGFVTNGVEQNLIFDTADVDVFKDNFFRDNLKKVEFLFEMENTINRAYLVNLVFLDNNNQSLHTIQLTIPAYAGVENKVTKTETFENAQLDLLKRTTKIAFTLTMLSGTPLNQSSPGRLKLRSGITAYLVVE